MYSMHFSVYVFFFEGGEGGGGTFSHLISLPVSIYGPISKINYSEIWQNDPIQEIK